MKPRLPDWEPRNARGRREFERWVNEQLDQIHEAELLAANAGASEITAEDLAVAAARDDGNLEPLRALHPDHADFINQKPPSRGRRRRSFLSLLDREQRLVLAVEDVPRIRALWKRELGHRNRPAGDELGAEEIAARRWHVDAWTVKSRLKSRRK